MFFLTEAESLQLLKSWGQTRDSFSPTPNSTAAVFQVCLTGMRSMAAGHKLIRLMDEVSIPCHQRIMLVTEFGVWPSSEDWNVYYTLRSSAGDRRQIQDAPGHLFNTHEQAWFFSYLTFAVRSGWGCLVAGNSDHLRFSFNHDGEALIVADDKSELIQQQLEDWPGGFVRVK